MCYILIMNSGSPEDTRPSIREIATDRIKGAITRVRNSLRKPQFSSQTNSESVQRLEETQERSGLTDSSGNLLLESPNPQLIAKATAIDSRIEYFPYRIPGKVIKKIDLGDGYIDEIREEPTIAPSGLRTVIPEEFAQLLSFYKVINRLGVGPNLFEHKLVLPFLTRHLKKYFADQQIVGIRGTACSIDLDNISIDGKPIKNIADIVTSGTETDKDHVPMIGFEPSDTSAEIPFRSTQWLVQHTEGIRQSLISSGQFEQASKIFPVLLVYDRSKFPDEKTVLPKSQEERSRVILKAFVLDFPHK